MGTGQNLAADSKKRHHESANDWFIGLATRLNEKEQYTPSGVWAELKQRTNPLERIPHPNAHVIARELKDRFGPYFILKNTQAKTYLRLSPAEYRLWTLMDGQLTVQELIVNHFMETGDFAHARVIHLVNQLLAHSMLDETPVAIWWQVAQAVQRRSWLFRLSAPARFLLTQKLNLNGLDRAVGALYREGGWLCFTRPAQIIFFLLSVLGLAAFFEVVRDGNFTFIGQNVVNGLVWVWVASLLPVVIHELGHALTVKHFGREVPRGGLMLYFGMPAAFVETTDIWLEPRRARLAVTWNGPYTGLILGGMVGLWIYFFPASPVNAFLFPMAGFAYATVFFNVNPLLKFDGYYLLADALDIHSLRERSLDFVREHLLHKIAEPKSLTREEWIFTIYGVLTAIWMSYAIYLAVYFWQTRVQVGVRVLLGSGYSLVARAFGLLLAVTMVSLLVLILLGLIRLGKALAARFITTGGLTRHGQLAWLLGGAALAVGMGIPAKFPKYAQVFSPIIGAAVAWLVAGRLFIFDRPYFGSWRGWAHLAFVGSLILGGLVTINNETVHYEQVVWGVVILMIVAGITLGRSVTLHWGLNWFSFLGVLAGAISAVGFHTVYGVAWNDPHLWGIAFLSAMSIWTYGSLRGGARAPAVMLFYMGGVLLAFSWFFSIPRLAAALLLSAGGLHLMLAQVPKLSSYEEEGVSSTQLAIGHSAAVIVRRAIAQVFFESGFQGVYRLGEKFSATMRGLGLELTITGNRFEDRELSQRGAGELTAVYGPAFDTLFDILYQELGREMGRLTFAYGIDLLPWQNREVLAELLLSRRAMGLALQKEMSDEQKTWRNLLKRVPLFVALDDSDLELIARRLKKERFGVGEVVVRQGDVGERFYIVARGKAAIWQTGKDGEARKIAQQGIGQFFGEAALVSDQTRNATVRAETPLTLLSLAKKDFNTLVRRHVSLAANVHPGVRHSWLLRGMPLFDELESHELDWMALQMEQETYHAGEVVFREGDPGDKFYIIESGQLVITRQLHGETVELSRRGSGEYVGEIALLHNRPRTATITANEDTTLFSLDAAHFQDLVSGYSALGQTLSRTGSRRLSFVEAVGVSPTETLTQE